MSAGRSQPSLAHPLWVASLIVLVVNDHLLKGADVVPAVLTGKLSDFAGLLVAPALLAWLLGESRRARIAAHVAVGGVFAALQLLPGFAALWDGTLTSLGLPWHTVPDPTDLVALPALFASWMVLRPTSRPAPHAPWLGAAGLAACLATSPPQDPRGTWTTTDWTVAPPEGQQVALLNDGEEILEVLVRQLRGDVTVDCEAFLGRADPGALLSAELFDVAVAWELPPRSAIAALRDPFAVRDCHAVLIDGPTLEPHVLFWEGREPVFGLESGTVSLSSLDDGGQGIVFPLAPRVDPECLVQPELDRVDWSAPQRGTFVLAGIAAGVDGCLSLDVGESEPIFVCMPEEAFPFVEGDTIEVSQAPGQLGLASPDAELTLAQLVRPGTVDGLQLDVELDGASCGYRVDPACAQVTSDAQVTVTREGRLEATLLPGGSAEVGGQTVWVTRAEVRAVTTPDCLRPGGPFDLDVIVVTLPE